MHGFYDQDSDMPAQTQFKDTGFAATFLAVPLGGDFATLRANAVVVAIIMEKFNV